jgi:hypothetical protein
MFQIQFLLIQENVHKNDPAQMPNLFSWPSENDPTAPVYIVLCPGFQSKHKGDLSFSPLVYSQCRSCWSKS